MNLVIFVFVLGNIVGKDKDSGKWARLEERTSMCTNTWGGMDKVFDGVKKGNYFTIRDSKGREKLCEIERAGTTLDTVAVDIMSEPVSNTQVSHGLWALASGGCKGQGWGRGKPSVIPACHTDMILSSIGEQKGWMGLLAIILAYFVLVWLVARQGLKTGDEFAIFLCMGIATVTAVQLLIIALGSAGVIPLTGVTVPLLSYGRVSMILNIGAFGLALSLITRKGQSISEEVKKQKDNNTKAYKRPYKIAVVCFSIGCALTLGVWAKHQWGIFQRDKTLIQPAFVINKQGDAVLEYNPRIDLVTNEMYTGRLYDRNGLLLATSDKNEISGKVRDSLEKHGVGDLDALKRRHLKRYYPWGDELFFMVGNLNTRLLFNSPESSPVGYMAEERHLSYLRGFDNVLYDKNDNRAVVRLVTDKKCRDRYLKPSTYTTDNIVLRDYSVLLPYLKDGTGDELKKHNNSVKHGDFDLHLTVDASLQVDLQNAIADYVKNGDTERNRDLGLKNNNLLRISVVVLNAKNGDLIASANYPKPDCKLIAKKEDEAKEKGKTHKYNDYYKDSEWRAYVDRDLGTTYQTAPGSTAKVMSAMAGFRKIGKSVSDTMYYVSPANRVELGTYPEPSGHRVSMREAIVQSSNCYFINLVNKQKLFSDLETVYKAIGASVGEVVPYYYWYEKDTIRDGFFHDTVSSIARIAYNRYSKFKDNPKRNDIKMNMGEWKWAWGQSFGDYMLKASPLNMARLASAVVNDGVMPYTQYVREIELRQDGCVPLIDKESADILKGYMKQETENHKEHRAHVPELPTNMGGKTGTAERTIYEIGHEKGHDINDGWYMFFVEGDDSHDPLAVAVRMERRIGSSTAVRLSYFKVFDVLKEHGYVKYVR